MLQQAVNARHDLLGASPHNSPQVRNALFNFNCLFKLNKFNAMIQIRNDSN